MTQRNKPYSFIAYQSVIFVSCFCIHFPLLQHICSVPIAKTRLASHLFQSRIPRLDPSRLLVLSNQLLNSSNVLLLRIRGGHVLDLSPLVVLGLAL
jgi:hypothetical protein